MTEKNVTILLFVVFTPAAVWLAIRLRTWFEKVALRGYIAEVHKKIVVLEGEANAAWREYTRVTFDPNRRNERPAARHKYDMAASMLRGYRLVLDRAVARSLSLSGAS